MAAQNIFKIDQSTSSINQGAYGAAKTMRRPIAFISTPSDFSLTPAEEAALKTTLQAGFINADPELRLQMLDGVGEINPTGQAPKKLTYTYGFEQTIYSGQYAFDIFFTDGNLIKQENRQKLNFRNDRKYFIVDDALQLCGTKGDDGTGLNVKQGFSIMEYYAANIALDMGEGAKQSTSIAFSDPNEFNHGNLMIAPMGFNPSTTLKNVADAYINPISTLVTRVVTVSVSDESYGSTILSGIYAAILGGGSGPANWVATDHATGLALTTSSAVAATVNGIEGITLTFAATNYPSAGGSIDIALAAPSVLVAAGMKPYESNILNLAV